MSLLLKAFPHGRPTSRARTQPRLVLAPVLVSVIALVAVLLPLAGPRRRSAQAAAAQTHQAHKQQVHKKQVHSSRSRRAKKVRKPRKAVGTPPRGYLVAPTSYFSFPNRSRAERVAIRKRVLLSIQSTWGGPRTRGRHSAARRTARSASPPGPSTTGTSRRRWSRRASAVSACR